MSRGLHAFYRTAAEICLTARGRACGLGAASNCLDLQAPQSSAWNIKHYAYQGVSALSIATFTDNDAEQLAAPPNGARARALPSGTDENRRPSAQMPSDAQREAQKQENLPIKHIVHRFKAGWKHDPLPCPALDMLFAGDFVGAVSSNFRPSSLQAAEDRGDPERMRGLMDFMAVSGTPPHVRSPHYLNRFLRNGSHTISS
jgi:hypothetical protein